MEDIDIYTDKIIAFVRKQNDTLLDSKNIQLILRAFSSHDKLAANFFAYPDHVLENIKSIDSSLFVPVYNIEIRQILETKRISGYALGLAKEPTQRYLGNSALIVEIALKDIISEPLIDLVGLKIYKDLRFTTIKNLYSFRRYDDSLYEAQALIAAEYDYNLNSFATVPGISITAQIIGDHQLNKYIVNVSTVGVDNEVIKAKSKQEALSLALTKAWERSNNDFKDEKYEAEFWINRGMLDVLVKSKVIRTSAQTLTLSPVEQKIANFLLEINAKYNLNTTFRIAGGWVRDKILGKESDDIDIAMDNITGEQLGQYLKKEIGKSGNTIKANPDQSKHLETLTVNLFGQDVDFVNLRSESYGDSRIPTMEFGDASTDAERRDLTINSLFYNINTSQIEDYTGKGIEDLKTMTLRTPLDPIKTFTDDPLRILRMLRFYSRYQGSSLDATAIEAMKDPSVQKALKEKVSPERIYTEWNKLFGGTQPEKALRILHETGLFSILFQDHLKSRKDGEEDRDFHPFTMDQNNPHHVDNVFEHTLKVVQNYNEILRADGAGDEERAKALAAAFLHDIGKLDPRIIGIKENAEGIIGNTYHGHEDVSAKVSESILSALKASNEDIKYISTIVQHHMVPHAHKSQDEMSDKQIRKLINKLGKDLLRRIVQHATADAGSKPGADLTPYHNLLQRVNTIEPSGQIGSGNLKPVLNGGILMKMFPTLSPKSGFIKEINDRLQDIKDGNPALTEQEAISIVESMRAEIQGKYPAMPQKQPSAPKTAQTYYSEMINMGTRDTVTWKCGTVVEANQKTYLYDGTKQYKIKLSGSKQFQFRDLSEYVGQKICARGIINGEEITISTFNVVKEQPTTEKKVQRKLLFDIIKFRPGDKVRHRERGRAFEQVEGRVEKVDKDLIYIKWDGVKDLEVFSLNDTSTLYRIIERV